MADSIVRRVDHSAIRVNQAFVISLLLMAFIFDRWLVVAFVSAVMIVGTIFPEMGLFKRIYRHVLRPLELVKPDVLLDNPEPHRFAQGLGGVFTLGGSVALALGLPLLGWALAWIVIVLAAVNLFMGFCAGCFVYYRLSRLGVPGFAAAPVERE